MISRPIALASAMSVPTSRPSHASAHCAVDVRRGSTDVHPGARSSALQHVVEEDRVRLTRVGAPQDHQVGVLRLPYDRVPPPAPNTVVRPTTLGSVSSAVAGVDVVAAHHHPGELLGQVVHLVGGLRAAEHAERVAAAAPRNPAAARSSASSQLAGRSPPLSRTSGSVSRTCFGVRRPRIGISSATNRSNGSNDNYRWRRAKAPMAGRAPHGRRSRG